MDQILEIQAECMADDVATHEHMTKWDEAQVYTFFESGGQDVPQGWEHLHGDDATAAMAGLTMREKLVGQIEAGSYSEAGDLESARSSVDGWEAGGRGGTSEAPTIPYADVARHEDVLAEVHAPPSPRPRAVCARAALPVRLALRHACKTISLLRAITGCGGRGHDRRRPGRGR